MQNTYNEFRQLIEVSKWSNCVKLVFFDFRLGRDVWILIEIDTNNTYELVWKNGKMLEGPINWATLEQYADITSISDLSQYLVEYVSANASRDQ